MGVKPETAKHFDISNIQTFHSEVPQNESPIDVPSAIFSYLIFSFWHVGHYATRL